MLDSRGATPMGIRPSRVSLSSLALLALTILMTPARAQDPDSQGATPAGQQDQHPRTSDSQTNNAESKATSWYVLAGQATIIAQQLLPFHSPYQGPLSLPSRSQLEATETVTGYLGVRVGRRVDVFANPEIALGKGIGGGNGLGGYTNDDLIGQNTLRPEPYLARIFVRYRLPLGHGGDANEVPIGRAPNLIPGKTPARRLVLTFGKMSVNDIFDLNQYANDPHTQFMNVALTNNAAYDYSQDTRGYDVGLTAAWMNPDFNVRYGIFQAPTVPGGPDLSGDILSRNGQQIEVTAYPRIIDKHRLTTVRLLGYRNDYQSGSFGATLAAANGGIPDITEMRTGGVKYGFGLNMEQPIGDGGATGLFLRWGWNNGATESSRTEVDRAFSLGAQVSGAKWSRKNDKIGIAFAQNDLSAVHKTYLEDGGLGTTLGDGQLSYGSEHIVEAYYSYQATKSMSLSLDHQWIGNPGYNTDRDPVSVTSFRVHFDF